MMVFYITLSFGRIILAAETRYGASRIRSQWKKYVMCGYLVLVMAIIMFIQTVLIKNGDYSIVYPGNTLWVVFGLNIYLIIYAITGWWNYKGWNCPLLTADRSLAFSACLLGLYSLLIAIADRYKMLGSRSLIFNEITGFGIMVTLIIISVYMIIHGAQQYVNTPDNTWLQ